MDHELQAKATELLRELLTQVESGTCVVTDLAIETETHADTGADTGRRTFRMAYRLDQGE